ncbi:Mitochondrial dicarboxylate carrier [Dirofilaria immitis]|nr:Mitochondrial dicarboxylate carrier [Dirofilaria immitis]
MTDDIIDENAINIPSHGNGQYWFCILAQLKNTKRCGKQLDACTSACYVRVRAYAWQLEEGRRGKRIRGKRNVIEIRERATILSPERYSKIMSIQGKEQRLSRWYFGGTASAGAAMCTHPLDLLKVHLQTQQHGKVGILEMTMKIIRSDGIRGLYNDRQDTKYLPFIKRLAISDDSTSILNDRREYDSGHYNYVDFKSLEIADHEEFSKDHFKNGNFVRMTYSLTRFGMYEQLKKQFPGDSTTIPFYQKAAMAGISGACGGFIGTPGDMINVRMQNDVKLLPAERRNYKHAFDGLFRVMREEGVTKLFNGAAMATSRAVFMTIGQLSFYDQIKQIAIATGYFKDNPTTHFGSSFAAASIATVLTQPLDVMKTRMMNAKPGQFSGILSCFLYTAKLGPAGFFKGFIPAWVRLAPQTILTFIFLEQLRLNFGYYRTPRRNEGMGGVGRAAFIIPRYQFRKLMKFY